MRNFDKNIFNLPTFMFLWSQSLHIWQIHWVFCLIFAGIKTKTSQSSLYSTAFFKILKEPALVQKPTIPHMKALIISYLEPEGWGRGIIMGAPRPPPVKVVIYLLSEAVEAKWGWWNKNKMFYVKSPYLRIPKIIDFWLQCHEIMKKYWSEMSQNESDVPVGGKFSGKLIKV